MTRLRPTALFKVRRISPHHWGMRDRTYKPTVIEYDLYYRPVNRQFDCSVRIRDTKKGRWSNWIPATPDQKEQALAAIGETEVARCMADSLLNRPTPW